MNELSRRGLVLGGVAGAASLVRPLQAYSQPADTELTFFTIGDWGRRGDENQCLVAGAMEIWRQKLNPKFIMTVGDNFYPIGQGWPFWSQWNASFTSVYSPELRGIPWVPALGNHDYWGSLDEQMRSHAVNGWESKGSRFYLYQPQTAPGGPTVDILVIDTSPLAELYFGSVGGRTRQKQWIEGMLKASTADWKLVFGHHAVFSGGQHGRSPRMANWLQQRLEDYGVQAYVCGHDHDLQHIVAGHRKAPHYILTGAGSLCDRPVIDVPGTYYQKEKRPGFTIFQLFDDELQVQFIEAGDSGRIAHTAHIPRAVADAPAMGTPFVKGKPAYQPLTADKRPEGCVHPDDRPPREPPDRGKCEILAEARTGT